MRRVLSAWAEMSDEQKAEAVAIKPEAPVAAVSAGPRPNVSTEPVIPIPEQRQSP